jgi:hypothetical protein
MLVCESMCLYCVIELKEFDFFRLITLVHPKFCAKAVDRRNLQFDGESVPYMLSNSNRNKFLSSINKALIPSRDKPLIVYL